MLVSELIRGLTADVVGSDVDVSGLAYDSRQIKPGDLFFAIPGFAADGHDFVADAVRRGAKAVVVERHLKQVDATQIIVGDSRQAMGEVSAAFFGYPARRIRLIGVTGTNGKTTTTYLIKSIFEQAGYKVGLIGTIKNMIGQENLPAVRTTPESLDLQKLLASMVQQGVEYVVMEVSSHALKLRRTAGVEYDGAVFTNLSQDHLDFHPSLEDYWQSKALLFKNLAVAPTKKGKVGVINADSEFGWNIATLSSAPLFFYGVDQVAQIRATDISITDRGVAYRLETPLGSTDLALNLTGRFNVYNSLAAASIALAEGIALPAIKQGLESVPGVSGRFELVGNGQDFAVIVDYAHSPDSLENILRTARGFARGRVIAVFGAGGDRDKGKRPIMGQIAARLSDYVFITSDNPRSEDPSEICRQIQNGIEEMAAERAPYEVIVDRRQAIRRAIHSARPGDIVIIAGKGHETYQEINGQRLHFDDREEALRTLKELQNDGED